MKYTIYKTTNLVNGKYYIGKHITKNPNDKYLGSGEALKAAIRKYGREMFTKEVLFIFDNEDEMNAKEQELVIVSEETYNMCPGGIGGNLSYTPWNKGTKGVMRAWNKNVARTDDEKNQIRETLISKGIKPPSRKGSKWSDDQRMKFKEAVKSRIPWNKGLTKSDPRVANNYKKNKKEETQCHCGQ